MRFGVVYISSGVFPLQSYWNLSCVRVLDCGHDFISTATSRQTWQDVHRPPVEYSHDSDGICPPSRWSEHWQLWLFLAVIRTGQRQFRTRWGVNCVVPDISRGTKNVELLNYCNPNYCWWKPCTVMFILRLSPDNVHHEL